MILDEHEKRCGGKFEKIKEPENYKAKGNKKRNANEIALTKNNQNENQPSTSSQGKYKFYLKYQSFLYNIVSSPSKKKKKITNNTIPNHGTIDRFFKKTNPTSSSSNDIKQVEPKKTIDTNSQEQTSTMKSQDDQIKLNYTKCSICQVLLPKANLFIHQIRCYK